jgi:hypothetical protein
MARLEGAYEQVADRLNGIEQRMAAGFAQIDSRFAQTDSRFARVEARLSRLDQKIDTNLRTMISWMLGQTAVILGAFAAFALHH